MITRRIRRYSAFPLPGSYFQDVRPAPHAALRHRRLLNFAGEAEGITVERVIDEILEKVAPDAKPVEAAAK